MRPSRKKKTPVKPAAPVTAAVAKRHPSTMSSWLWLAGILTFTAICFWPMLKNGFTNWDDDVYVLKNTLLQGPDWKGIWTTSVAANYHPVTMLTLAFNYHLSGLDPSSYLWTNLFLHLVDTALVFFFVRMLTGKSLWIPLFCALVFGIHPMHVESVAWVSERKDQLYTLFFLLSLMAWWRFTGTKKRGYYVLSFFFCILSLLSKPAAVILPVVLLLLDYLRNRPIRWMLLVEKIPFFLSAVFLAILTLRFQTVAMTGLDVHTPLDRFFFACYSTMTYAWKFFLPVNLSAVYPFPIGKLATSQLLSPLFIVGLAGLLWIVRKDRPVVFGILFFLVNLALVMQFVTVGQSLVSERYTYVPYIGLSFAFGSWLVTNVRNAVVPWLLFFVVAFGFGFACRERIHVWKNSELLWNDVIHQFPRSALARENRASFYVAKAKEFPEGSPEAVALNQKALADADIVLAIRPRHQGALNARGQLRLQLGNYAGAVEDASLLILLDPKLASGYLVRGKALTFLGEPNKALTDLDRGVELAPEVDNAYYDRGALLFNSFGRYKEAMADFDKAIALQPKGLYYMTRSFCHYKLGDTEKAKTDALMAEQQGMPLPTDYRAMILR